MRLFRWHCLSFCRCLIEMMNFWTELFVASHQLCWLQEQSLISLPFPGMVVHARFIEYICHGSGAKELTTDQKGLVLQGRLAHGGAGPSSLTLSAHVFGMPSSFDVDEAEQRQMVISKANSDWCPAVPKNRMEKQDEPAGSTCTGEHRRVGQGGPSAQQAPSVCLGTTAKVGIQRPCALQRGC